MHLLIAVYYEGSGPSQSDRDAGRPIGTVVMGGQLVPSIFVNYLEQYRHHVRQAKEVGNRDGQSAKGFIDCRTEGRCPD